MHDFGKFCYLDVPKTGSTFIVEFLDNYSNLKMVEFVKHGRISRPEQMEPGKFFFISVRDPIEQYKSLYFHGAGQQGSVFDHVTKDSPERLQFYDGTEKGFCSWLEYVLEPENISVFGTWPDDDGQAFGPMTHRFLSLSFYRPFAVMKNCRDYDQIVDVYHKQKIHNAIVRTESLNEDLAILVDGPLRDFIKKPRVTSASLRVTTAKVNESERIDRLVDFSVPSHLLAKIRDRERFLYDVIGYK